MENSEEKSAAPSVAGAEMQKSVESAENTVTAEQTAETYAIEQSAPKPTKKQQFLQFLKFAAFSASAGVIQLVSTSVLHEWTGWLVGYYYIAYIIGLTLSVIWNFTFNRKFTFKAANNIPLAMVLVVIYNLIIVVPLAFGGDELVKLWGADWGILVTAISLLINFITEFFWDKFVVFNPKVTDKILSWFKKK
ncbi:MAG: GtrA family protein [Clostridia bacterium]|nr:GtrA family protein [Clostridia bacterium]